MLKNIKRIFGVVVTDLTTQESFNSSWYSYTTNQVSHIALGSYFVFLISILFFILHGDFPNKISMFFIILVIAVLWETADKRWNGLDSIEDIIFTVLYGAGIPLLTLSEVVIKDVCLSFNPYKPIPIILIAIIHLSYGITKRILPKKKV